MNDLPAPGDPYVTDFDKVVESDGSGTHDIAEYTERRAIQRFTKFQAVRSLDPSNTPEADQQEQLSIAVVFTLRVMGMDLPDIAEYVSVPLSEIERIVAHPAMQQTYERVLNNLISNNANNIQGRIVSHANNAVETVLELMNEKETRDDVRLKAAQDILDRSGTNADQFFSADSQQQGREDELNIVFTDEDGEDKGIKVNLKRK